MTHRLGLATGGDGDTTHLGRPANMNVDPATNELFIADGYKNHRVIVFDAQTGAYKRHWGANGRPPGDPSVKSFGNPVHCARLAKDGLLYVCDRMNNIWTLLRDNGQIVGKFGRNGRQAGQLHWVHNLAVDSKGNVYTAEVDSGKRAQKFMFKGLGPAEP
jgi:DNA-binding beta-propeller fold protein YncE